MRHVSQARRPLHSLPRLSNADSICVEQVLSNVLKQDHVSISTYVFSNRLSSSGSRLNRKKCPARERLHFTPKSFDIRIHLLDEGMLTQKSLLASMHLNLQRWRKSHSIPS